MKLTKIFAIVSLGILCSNSYALTNHSTNKGEKKTMKTSLNKHKYADSFLTENQNKPGVITLADGLQYKVIVEGHGPKPTLNDVVTVHYAGTLTDGTEFDSSYKRNAPASFPVGGVIAGWVEALQLMNVGSIWELYIPAELAYGTRGAPPVIGPNQTLIFKVELISK